jgi:hypothetical protein
MELRKHDGWSRRPGEGRREVRTRWLLAALLALLVLIALQALAAPPGTITQELPDGTSLEFTVSHLLETDGEWVFSLTRRGGPPLPRDWGLKVEGRLVLPSRVFVEVSAPVDSAAVLLFFLKSELKGGEAGGLVALPDEPQE